MKGKAFPLQSPIYSLFLPALIIHSIHKYYQPILFSTKKIDSSSCAGIYFTTDSEHAAEVGLKAKKKLSGTKNCFSMILSKLRPARSRSSSLLPSTPFVFCLFLLLFAKTFLQQFMIITAIGLLGPHQI